MKVILLQELRGKGGEGDVVEVTRGYAVNYLLPKKFAIEATKGNLKQLELRKHNIARREAERLDTADKVLAGINEKSVVIRARVGEEGQLFGSVTAAMISDALQEQFGATVDRRKIDLRTHIKTAGEHTVSVGIYRDLKASIIVNVVDEKIDLDASAVAEEAVAESTEVADAAADEAVASEGVVEAAEIVESAADEAAPVAEAYQGEELADAPDEAIVSEDAE
ncbi:MAG: 50S ribosomal protein L9 [Coriobacteriales bacterium]|jgi:large subunit ribosomal protein L9|nr:50S ribosomal protein L9 [Coriobacteriales bacterium]